MSATHAIGESKDPFYISESARSFEEIPDQSTRGMVGWVLGNIGGGSRLLVEFS